MPLLTQPAFGPKLSIGLILFGTLMDVWTLVWRYTLAPDELSDNQRFWYLGFLLTGGTFLVVGLTIGQIGRAARRAELPPPEATRKEAQIQATGAANPAGAAMPGGVPAGMPAAGMVPGAAQVPAAPMPPAGAQGVIPGQQRTVVTPM